MNTNWSESLDRLWGRALEIAPVDDSSNFFDLGGDSLSAIELVTAFEEETGLVFPIELLFLDGTLGAIRQELERESGR